jgi:dihydrofolate reductase
VHITINSMRKVITCVAVSLDGFIEGPNGEFDCCFMDQDYGLSEFLKRIDSAFLGRKTYELILSMPDDDASGLPGLKKYVFSKTLKKVPEGTTLIKNNISSEVIKIKSETGKDIWLFGGASLNTALLNLCLVDELLLAVHPILLGNGKALTGFLDKRNTLKLMDSTRYSTDLLLLRYQVENNGKIEDNM